MASSFHRRWLPKLILIAAALAVGVFLSRGGDSDEVSATGNYTAETNVTLSTTATSAASDSTIVLDIPGSDMNFGNVVTLAAQGSCVAGKPPSDGAGGVRLPRRPQA